MSMLLNIPNCPYNFRVRTFSYQFFCDIFPVASVTASHIIIKNNLSGINWQIRPFILYFLVIKILILKGVFFTVYT